MGSALTGQLGLPGSQLGLLQLGGPGYVQQFTRSRPASARPLMAHVYASDGVTFVGALGPLLTRPAIRWRANGSYDPITLDLPAPSSGASSMIGFAIVGSAVIGGISVGQIVKLTEQGGDGSVIYAGTIEETPDSIGPTSHQILLKPLANELDTTMVSLVYTVPTDVAQMVRDAVAQTAHLSCDQVSVPAVTGVLYPQAGGAAIDFSFRFAKEVLDVVKHFLGPSWFWFVGVDGRVWLQAMGSVAAYTLMRGQHYQSRQTNGGSIADMRNNVPVVGGVPPGGSAPVVARYRSRSFGVDRTLQQPVSLPGITDQAALNAVAHSIGVTLDRVWTLTSIDVLPTLGQPAGQPNAPGARINMAQPGGAIGRYFESAVGPLQESESGMGGYAGPFIVTDCTDDGLTQKIAIGDVPVTDPRDIAALAQAALNRALHHVLLYTPAALNVQGVVTSTGGLATAPNPAPGTLSPPRWAIDAASIRGYDGTSNDYGAPSGPGVGYEFTPDGRGFLGGRLTLQSAKSGPRLVLDSAAARAQTIDPNGQTRFEWGNIPALGISPAQWGPRVIDALGNPKLDGLGPISGGVMSSMGLAAVFVNSAATSTSFVAMPTAVSISITVANRAFNVLIFFFATAWITGGSGAIRIRTNVVGVAASGPFKFGVTSAATNGFGHLILTGLAPGTYTVQNEYATDSGVSGFIDQSYVEAFQLGS